MGFPCCCDPSDCCVTPKELAADITFGALPDFDDVALDAFGDCYVSTDGYYGTDHHTNSHFEHVVTSQKAAPDFGINALIAGEWIWSEYDYLPYWYVSDGTYTVECYYFALGISGYDLLRSKVTDISGTIQLIQGNEPDIWPYWVKMEYYIYEDGEGDCIMRVGARFYPSPRRNIPSLLAERPETYLDGHQYLNAPGETWANTTITEHKYSDQNPCLEDFSLDAPLAGLWERGERIIIDDAPLESTIPGSPASSLWASGDFSQSDDPTFMEPSDPTGISNFGWVWEINLTDAGITDIADLPDTTLDWSNMIGTYTGDIKGSYTPKASLPVGYSNNFWRFYTASSVTLNTGVVAQANSTDLPFNYYNILNGGLGAHLCATGDPGFTPPCGEWDGGGVLQWDGLGWYYEYDVSSGYFDVLWTALSITLKQPPP